MSKFALFNRSKNQVSARQDPPIEGEVVPAGAGVSNLASSSSFDEWSEAFPFLKNGGVNKEQAMKLTAVFGCVSLMAGTIGTLPARVRRKDEGKGAVTFTDHPVHELISDEPHALFSPEVMFEGLSAISFLDGNAYAEIERNRRGDPIGIRPLFDATCKPFLRKGRAAYSITENGDTYGRDQNDILHFRGSATMSGLEALSPLKCFGRTIGIGLDADEMAEAFYKRGSNPAGFLSFDGAVSPEVANEIRNKWAAKMGGLDNAHLPAVLSNGGKFTSLMLDPETAQLLQSRSFQVIDVARAYGVPPHLIGEATKSTSWGSGIESQTTQFYILTMRKHLKRFESELKRKLLTKQERLRDGISIKFDIDTLLRADLTTRYQAHKESLGGTQGPGWRTINEVRELEGLPKSKESSADKIYVPVNKPGAGDPPPPKPPKKGQ